MLRSVVVVAVLAAAAFAGEPSQPPAGHAGHAAPAGAAAPAAPGTRELVSVNIEYRGTKVWVPSTFIVKKGEPVRLTLINNAPSGVHGWAADEFNIKVAVNNTEKDNTKVVEFTPAKAGLVRTYCHLHPAHIGGQILVIE